MRWFCGLLIGLIAVAGPAHAACDSDLYGSWRVTGKSYHLNKDIRPLSFNMMWRFKEDGMVDINIAGMVSATEPFQCRGRIIAIQKSVPAYLSVIKLTASALVYQEKGNQSYYYLER